MDPDLQTLGVQLADTAIRNTAASVADRVTAARARKRDQETIAELEDIVSSLLTDKSELVRIAQAYEQELVAQRISASDIAFIADNVVPLLEQLTSVAPASGANNPGQALALIRPILSAETVTILQLIGFNFRQAIGEPLTELVRQLISSRLPVRPTQGLSSPPKPSRR